MSDANRVDRQRGIDAGHIFLRLCECMYYYDDLENVLSRGMRDDIHIVGLLNEKGANIILRPVTRAEIVEKCGFIHKPNWLAV